MRLKTRALSRAYIWLYGDWLPDDTELLAPDRRDLHLFPLTDELVTRLSFSRYSLEELVLISRKKYPHRLLNEDLVWRALTYGERRRWVMRAAPEPNRQGECLWDLTKEGETQASSVRVSSERARLGGLIAFLGLVAGIFAGGDVGTYARYGLGVLVGLFLFFLLVIAFTRRLLPYGIDFINAQEERVHEALRRNGEEPWWPPRPGPKPHS